MLTLRISERDLVLPWGRDGDRWVAGDSFIAPYQHPTLEAYVIESGTRFALIVRESLGGRSHRVHLRVHEVPVENFESAVDDAKGWPLDFVIATVQERDPDLLTVHAGAWGTAPLFFVVRGDTLFGHWDAAQLYGVAGELFDLNRVVFELAFIATPYSRRTLFPEMLMLTERAVASWSNALGLRIVYPVTKPYHAARDLTGDARVLDVFEDLFAGILRRWLGDEPSSVYSELSGGLDSGVAVAILRRRFPRAWVETFGLIMPGAIGMEQCARRQELVGAMGALDHPIEAARFPLFYEEERVNDPIIPWCEYYHEAFRELLIQVREHGGHTLFRGIGGDEISGLTLEELGEESSAGAHEQPLLFPSFLTNEALQRLTEAQDVLDPAPAGAAASSFYQAAAACAPLFLRNGIWPLHPYGTPELISFCRNLPTEWRQGRTLQRRLLKRFGLSDRLVHPNPPESFLPVRDYTMRESASFVRRILADSRLVDLGLIKQNALIASYDQYRNDPSWPEAQNLVEVVVIELTLRALERSGSIMQ